MKKSLILGSFLLSALVWAGAQQPSNPSMPNGAQANTPGAQANTPSAGQTPSTAPSGAPQATPQAAGQAPNAPVTAGCLGGSNPNFTITDTAGKTYKLNLPANADGTRLTPHVGESVQVMGEVHSNSIDVTKIGRGTGTCPAK